MSGSTRRAVALGLAAGGLAGAASGQAPPAGDSPADLGGTVQFDLGGTAERPPWRIFLRVPPRPAPPAGWPVLYLLDGNAVTGTAVDIARAQAPYPGGTGLASSFAVVGIGYPVAGPYDSERRSFDYGPPPGRTYPPHRPDGPPVRTGGAAEFLRFLAETLKPAIARRFPVDGDRQALFGHSFGGLFTLYALGEKPDLFTSWIAVSPSIYWEDFALLPSIDRLEARPDVRARVLLMAGQYEGELAPFQRDAPDAAKRQARLDRARTVERACSLAARLDRHPGIEAFFRLVPGRTHMAVLPEALNEAASFAFGVLSPDLTRGCDTAVRPSP